MLFRSPKVTITYFQPDERKAGGKYITATGAVKKVDGFERRITMQDGAPEKLLKHYAAS